MANLKNMQKRNHQLTCPSGTSASPCFLVRNGTRLRKPKAEQGKSAPQVRIQRYFCRTHDRWISLPSPELLRYFHYQASVVNGCIERSIRGASPLSIAHGSLRPTVQTIRRWVRRAREAVKLFKERVVRLNRKPCSSWVRFTLSGLWERLTRLASRSGEKRLPIHYALTRSP